MRKHPYIIAHRGASEYAQENSLEAFQLAVKQGAEIIEMDIRITKDQVLVMNHNDRLSLLKGTKISKLTYDELIELGYRPQKLTDALKIIPKNILINLDLKNTSMDLALAQILSSKEEQKRIIFDSNNVQLLNRYIHHFPDAKHAFSTGSSYDPLNISGTFVGRLLITFLPLLLSYPARVLFKRKVNSLLPEYISLYARFCSKTDVDFYHSLGVKVFVYVVNKEKNMQKFIEMGIDGIKTDRPDLLKQVSQQFESAQ